jgi:energy-coupling factor transporter ATP-binding protein EcfA2
MTKKIDDFEKEEQEIASKIPQIYIHNLYFRDFKGYDQFNISFENKEEIKKFVCLLGPNGYGKTTILDAIQLLFVNLDGYDIPRRENFLRRNIRNDDNGQRGNSFTLIANMSLNNEKYTYEINQSGIIQDHPQIVKEYLSRICVYAKFDQELDKFVLTKKNWPKFKHMFEEVTGFEIYEDDNEGFTFGNINPLFEDQVMGFYVKKPKEIIHNKDCSAGEKKVIKTFSSLLTQPIPPSIILIDNFSMHVELGRHLNLVRAVREAFPDTQLITTTHSYRISRNIKPKDLLYDLRVLKGSDLLKEEPWRITLFDKMQDSLEDLKSLDVPNIEKIKNTQAIMNDILTNDKYDMKFIFNICSNVIAENNKEYFLKALHI